MHSPLKLYEIYTLLWKNKKQKFLYKPAFKPGANTGERFVVELPSDTLESVTVGKSMDGRLPRAVMDAATLTGGETQEEACVRTHIHKRNYIKLRTQRKTRKEWQSGDRQAINQEWDCCLDMWVMQLFTSDPALTVRKLSTVVRVPVCTHTHTHCSFRTKQSERAECNKVKCVAIPVGKSTDGTVCVMLCVPLNWSLV